MISTLSIDTIPHRCGIVLEISTDPCGTPAQKSVMPAVGPTRQYQYELQRNRAEIVSLESLMIFDCKLDDAHTLFDGRSPETNLDL